MASSLPTPPTPLSPGGVSPPHDGDDNANDGQGRFYATWIPVMVQPDEMAPDYTRFKAAAEAKARGRAAGELFAFERGGIEVPGVNMLAYNGEESGPQAPENEQEQQEKEEEEQNSNNTNKKKTTQKNKNQNKNENKSKKKRDSAKRDKGPEAVFGTQQLVSALTTTLGLEEAGVRVLDVTLVAGRVGHHSELSGFFERSAAEGEGKQPPEMHPMQVYHAAIAPSEETSRLARGFARDALAACSELTYCFTVVPAGGRGRSRM